MSKAILLFSGGLDSILAHRVLMHAGAGHVQAVFFETPFFLSGKPRYYAEKNSINLKIVPVYNEFEPILRNPEHGYGKCLNPCIDCHTFMINRAIGLMHSEHADFVATGEVLGQRPMSQNRRAFAEMGKHIVEHQYLLRPLCAQLMEPTPMENRGMINRERLLGLEGRSRARQIALAETYGISEYPNPSGGCLLTMKEYADNVRRIMDMNLLTERNALLLKNGRIVFYGHGFAIMGRDREQNEGILALGKGEPLYQIAHGRGPVGIMIGSLGTKEREDFIRRMKDYSTDGDDDEIIRIQ